jgi:hypothetical protein
MSPSRKLLVFDTYKREDIKPPETDNDVLPLVHSIPGRDDDPGLIELTTGGVRRIISLNGFEVPVDEHDSARIEQTFSELLDCLDKHSTLQLLAINRPVDVNTYVNDYLDIKPKDSPYLEWYAEYTKKWFRKVCDVALVPKKSFYVIVGVDGTRAADQSKHIARLDKLAKKVKKVLSNARLNPQILSRSQTRRVLFSSLRPSYPAGLNDQPVETLRRSSMPDVSIDNSKQFMVLDERQISNQTVSSLPASMKTGWLLKLITMPFSSTLSLHCRIADPEKVLKSAKNSPSELKQRIVREVTAHGTNLIELSFYLTISPSSEDENESINVYRDHAKSTFSSSNALITARCDQFSAWTATLPLGIDCGGIAHCIARDEAAKCWPLNTATCGSAPGLPVGFAKISREPVFFNHEKRSGVYALASRNEDLRFFHALMAIRLLTANFHILHFDDGQNSLQILEEVLGPQLVNNLRGLEEVVDDSIAKLDSLQSTAALTVFSADHYVKDNFMDLIERWEKTYGDSERPLAIFLPGISEFGRTKTGIKSLKRLFDFVARKNILLNSSALTSDLKELEDLQELLDLHCETKVVLPQKVSDQRFAAKFLKLGMRQHAFKALNTRNRNDEYQVFCFLQTKDNRGLVSLVPSPMDFWLCCPHNKKRSDQVKQMKEELHEKYPRLSQTDLARQTFYYLGLEG